MEIAAFCYTSIAIKMQLSILKLCISVAALCVAIAAYKKSRE